MRSALVCGAILVGLLAACSSDESNPASAAPSTGGAAGAAGAAGADAGGHAGESGGAGTAAVGGHAGEAGSGPPAGEIEVCEAYWGEVCAAYEKCVPMMLYMTFPDVASCANLMTDRCVDYVFSEESNTTPQQFQACTDAVAPILADCGAFEDWLVWGITTVAACDTPAGQLADGAECSSSYQCETSHCSVPSGSTCGSCTKLLDEGGDCTSGDCKGGLVCTSGVCTKMPGLGDACSYSNACGPKLACIQSKCVEHADIGESCTPTPQNDHCRFTGWCNTDTTTCEPYGTSATDAEPCGILGASIEYCAPGFICRISNKNTFTGTCEPRRKLGETCEELYAVGGNCYELASCVDGTCQAVDPHTCE
jgi:hypothetical protein